MRVLFVASEAAPFSKTGGLADVAGALPRALARRGVDVALFTPYHLSAARGGFPAEDTGAEVAVPLGPETVRGRVLRSVLPRSSVPVYFLRHDGFFGRGGLYQEGGRDHPDNAARFAFFSRAALACLEPLDLRPDVLHVHDWQAALVPVYARTLFARRPRAAGAGVLLTLHNLGYQGVFWHWDLPLLGLPWDLFHWKRLEFWGKLNLLKGGIVYADRVNTVSRTYAREIRTPEFGCGLEGVLEDRAGHLRGIPNGIDTDEWNPATDPHIAANYDARDLAGKALCKAALLEEAGLDGRDHPLFACITRLDAQKGVDLVLEALDDAVALGMRLVILGTGDPALERGLARAQERHPGRVRAFLTFDAALAHRIEAGADAFLMPSRYEPCGLNQLMSLRYGTVPVVRATGGLADTVADVREAPGGRGTGFVFRKAEASALLAAVARAMRVYTHPPSWRGLVARGMEQDWSWDRSAAAYEALYEEVRQARQGAPPGG